MEGNYQVNDVVYKGDVTRPLPKNAYLGLTEGEWKCHFYNQKSSFENNTYSNKTTRSNYMGRLKIVSSQTPNLK